MVCEVPTLTVEMVVDGSSMRQMLRKMKIDVDDCDGSRDREAVWGPNPKRSNTSREGQKRR